MTFFKRLFAAIDRWAVSQLPEPKNAWIESPEDGGGEVSVAPSDGSVQLAFLAILVAFLAGWYGNDLISDPLTHCRAATGQLAERCTTYRTAMTDLEYFVADRALD